MFREEMGQPTAVSLPGESPWTEKPGRVQSMGLQRVGHDWATKHRTQGTEQGWIYIPLSIPQTQCLNDTTTVSYGRWRCEMQSPEDSTPHPTPPKWSGTHIFPSSPKVSPHLVLTYVQLWWTSSLWDNSFPFFGSVWGCCSLDSLGELPSWRWW